jgi:tripartite-type tricarboxylate transporter receptor subunit TctC
MRLSFLEEWKMKSINPQVARQRPSSLAGRKTSHKWVIACLAAIALIPAAPVWAQSAGKPTYPDKPIRIIVSFPPGGAADFAARIIAQKLPELLGGQAVIIDNRGGAGGIIGNDLVAKAAPDGYTLLVTSESTITINPSIYPNLPYVPQRDLTAITQLIKFPEVIVAHPSVPVNSIKELIALAKSQPGKLNYSHSGIGTVQQLSAELFKLDADVNITSVPYKGGGPAMLGLLGNETQVSFASPPSAIPYIKSGKLKALAVTSGERFSPLPDLPTVKESGLPGYEVEGWMGFFAPAKTPDWIIARLYDATAKILKMPEVQKMVHDSGAEVGGMSPREANEAVRKETEMWSGVVKTTGVKVE